MGVTEERRELAIAQKSESFIRQNAIFKVIPVASFYKEKGDVVVKVSISQEGEVDEAVCIKGPKTLRPIAEEAARRWKFKPILDKGISSRVESSLTFNFGR
jgi:TonB family protein